MWRRISNALQVKVAFCATRSLAWNGLQTAEELQEFFANTTNPRPHLISDMDKAVAWIQEANGKYKFRDHIYGDYDADGHEYNDSLRNVLRNARSSSIVPFTKSLYRWLWSKYQRFFERVPEERPYAYYAGADCKLQRMNQLWKMVVIIYGSYHEIFRRTSWKLLRLFIPRHPEAKSSKQRFIGCWCGCLPRASRRVSEEMVELAAIGTIVT